MLFSAAFEIQTKQILELTLSLLMLRVLADHTDLTLSLDDFAFFANRFY